MGLSSLGQGVGRLGEPTSLDERFGTNKCHVKYAECTFTRSVETADMHFVRVQSTIR